MSTTNRTKWGHAACAFVGAAVVAMAFFGSRGGNRTAAEDPLRLTLQTPPIAEPAATPAAVAFADGELPLVQDSVWSLGPGSRMIVTFHAGVDSPERMQALLNPPGARPVNVERHLAASNALVVSLPADPGDIVRRITALSDVRFVDEDDEAVRVDEGQGGGVGGTHPGGGGSGGFHVNGSLPSNGMRDVVPGQQIKFAFSQDVKSSTVVFNSTFVVRQGAATVAGGTLSWQDSRTLRYVPPSGHWANGLPYTVTLTTGIRNKSNVRLAAAYAVGFTGVVSNVSTLTTQPLLQISGPNPTLNGAGVHVAVLDSGVDTAHLDRPVNLRAGVSMVDGNPSPVDDSGHGTAVIGLLAGNTFGGRYSVAPQVAVTPVKVLNASNSGTTSDLVEGINWCRSWNASNPADPIHVISMSLINYPSNNGALNAALAGAAADGVLPIASAGNSSGGAVTWPAGHADVVAVSAIDNNNQFAYFSSQGTDVEVCAPGNFLYTTRRNGGYQNFSGTSASAPLVSGAAALYRQAYPGLTNSALRTMLRQTADPVGLPANQQGSGRVDCTEID